MYKFVHVFLKGVLLAMIGLAFILSYSQAYALDYSRVSLADKAYWNIHFVNTSGMTFFYQTSTSDSNTIVQNTIPANASLQPNASQASPYYLGLVSGATLGPAQDFEANITWAFPNGPSLIGCQYKIICHGRYDYNSSNYICQLTNVTATPLGDYPPKCLENVYQSIDGNHVNNTTIVIGNP